MKSTGVVLGEMSRIRVTCSSDGPIDGDAIARQSTLTPPVAENQLTLTPWIQSPFKSTSSFGEADLHKRVLIYCDVECQTGKVYSALRLVGSLTQHPPRLDTVTSDVFSLYSLGTYVYMHQVITIVPKRYNSRFLTTGRNLSLTVDRETERFYTGLKSGPICWPTLFLCPQP